MALYDRAYAFISPAVTWLKYCRYGVKLFPTNQSINQSFISQCADTKFRGNVLYLTFILLSFSLSLNVYWICETLNFIHRFLHFTDNKIAPKLQ